MVHIIKCNFLVCFLQILKKSEFIKLANKFITSHLTGRLLTCKIASYNFDATRVEYMTERGWGITEQGIGHVLGQATPLHNARG